MRRQVSSGWPGDDKGGLKGKLWRRVVEGRKRIRRSVCAAGGAPLLWRVTGRFGRLAAGGDDGVFFFFYDGVWRGEEANDGGGLCGGGRAMGVFDDEVGGVRSFL